MSRDSERPAAARVTMYPDGPLILRGDFEVCSVDGATIETGRIVALCRCGRSAAKPLCDTLASDGPTRSRSELRSRFQHPNTCSANRRST
jgi:hypothetical protein